jgi:xylulokinase
VIAPFAIGIDVGTTSLKAIAVAADGTVLASASEQHGIDALASGVQVDAARWRGSMITALRRLAEHIDLAEAGAVGFSGNMSSVVLIDDNGQPIAPILLLADPRGAEQIAALPAEVRGRILEVAGNEPSTVFALASLLWWQATHPEVIERATAWLSAKDYLRSVLTGEAPLTDATDAHNGCVLRNGAWDADLITALGLPRRIFPPVAASHAVAGRVTAEAASLTGIGEGTAVAVGAGDVAAALVGMGGLGEDTLAISLGTSATLMAGLGSDRPAGSDSDAPAMTVHPAADGSWFALGSLLTGGLALNWLRTILRGEPIAEVSDVPDDTDPLVFLPYLAGTGSPDFVATATGSLLGLRPATEPAHIVAALLEAIAFDMADLVDRLSQGARRYRRIVVSGGGSNIEAWPQIIADVIRLPVDKTPTTDLSAVGAAMLAWRAIGVEARATPSTDTQLPRPEHSQAWLRRHERYRRLRQLLLAPSSTTGKTERNKR